MWFSNRFMTLLSKTLNSIQPSNENQFKSQQDIIIGIIGSANVGKTTFIHNGLDAVISYPVTSNVRQHSSSITINNKQHSILILETNNLKDLTTLVHAVFICYDITQQSSIDMVPDILKHFRSQNIPSYLFGLKEDLSLLRQVDTTIGDQLSKIFNIPFYELNTFNSHHIYHLLKSILTKTHSKESSNVSFFLPPPPPPLNQPLTTTTDSSIKNNNNNNSDNNKDHYRISSTISNNSNPNQPQYGFVYAPTSSDYPLSSIQPSVYDSSVSPSQILFLQKRRGSKDSCESSSTGLTVDSIIDRLIGYDNMNEDDHIIPVFIIFFRKFMKPSELVKVLIERFEQDKSISILPTPMQKRIISILSTWVSDYWSDFTNKKTRQYLHQFVKRSQQIESMKSILDVLQSLINQPPPYYDPDCSWGQTDNDNDYNNNTTIVTTTTKRLEDSLQQQKDNGYLTYFDFQPDFMSKYLDEQALSHPSTTTTTTTIDPSVRSSLSSSSYPMLSSYIARDSVAPYHHHHRLSLLSSSSSSSSSAIPSGSGGYSLSLSIPPYSSSSEMTTISDSIYGFPSPPSQSSLRSIKQQQQVMPPACKSSSSSQHKLSLRQTKSMQINSSLSSSSSSSYKLKGSNNDYNNKITQQPKYGGGLLLLNFSFNTSNVHFYDNNNNNDNNNNSNNNNNNSLAPSIQTNGQSHLTATTASIIASSTTSLSSLSTSSDISSSCISSSSLTSSASSSLSITNKNSNGHGSSSKINPRLSSSFPASITSHFKSLSSSSSSTSLAKKINNYNNKNHPLFLSSTSIATSTTSSSTIGLNNKNKKQQQMRKKKNKQQSKKNLISKWLSLESIRPSSSFTSIPLSSSSPLNHPFKKSMKKDTKIFLSIPSQYMAEQLTWIEAELFGQIKSREFIRMIWAYSTDQTKKQQQQSSSSLSFMSTSAMLIDNETNLDYHQKKNHPLYTNALQASISHFNFISAWVISMIVLQPKLKKRIALLEKFMVIAVTLRNQNNYNTLMAILAGINNTSVLRLRQTQQFIVKKKIYKKFQSLEKLMSSHRSYCSYRLALKQSSSPCIPYLGIHNQDLIALAEANKDMKSDGTIHWEKFKLMGDCIVAIVKYQKQKHSYTPNIMIQKWLSRITILSDEEQYQQSILIEPRIKSTNSMNQLRGRLLQL